MDGIVPSLDLLWHTEPDGGLLTNCGEYLLGKGIVGIQCDKIIANV